MRMILKYWNQKEHNGGAIFQLNIHLRVGSSKTSKHSTVAFTGKKYYSASVITVELIPDYFINWYINEKINIIKTD